MRYYSEETVKALLENVSLHTLQDCPSVEIPDKHGDLMDKDKFKEAIAFIAKMNLKADESWIRMLYALDDAPTVLEASNGNTD